MSAAEATQLQGNVTKRKMKNMACTPMSWSETSEAPGEMHNVDYEGASRLQSRSLHSVYDQSTELMESK